MKDFLWALVKAVVIGPCLIRLILGGFVLWTPIWYMVYAWYVLGSRLGPPSRHGHSIIREFLYRRGSILGSCCEGPCSFGSILGAAKIFWNSHMNRRHYSWDSWDPLGNRPRILADSSSPTGPLLTVEGSMAPLFRGSRAPDEGPVWSHHNMDIYWIVWLLDYGNLNEAP